MLDNGAFSVWRSGKKINWPKFYDWCDEWLHCPTTWAVPPDVIDAGTQEQDALLREWPHGKNQSAPVWHMDEPVGRLLQLVDSGWSRVCIGSTAEYSRVMSKDWQERMDECWNALLKMFGRAPKIHMLRGMQCSGHRWPFYSLDSTDIGQNHRRPTNGAAYMAARWDGMQCALRWNPTNNSQKEIAL
ncbi:hypothetical protein [Acetobacter oeni]|uniref:Uncharacterized protein n=1 Tax=Acetobacter oeni TaxID=304077 RepID=A0A511XJS1_9PROT|nr:hypothetical protein [Acetobacter oeni]MBB3883405.1 hypothetical protein [Acetobacter oeni]NHO19378.1 hypothetical protein [Acetobacter oeni]GBR03950.1 hypothetical protein AA21952_1238 [Acetobacter oeni LMG 21952]GEN63186.1 hypothetical protein AOE01nite_14100 [Acetobacter oeni]